MLNGNNESRKILVLDPVVPWMAEIRCDGRHVLNRANSGRNVAEHKLRVRIHMEKRAISEPNGPKVYKTEIIAKK
jgi:hypothetical protein